ncbi:MAG: FAD-dependent oxidoreductase [Acidobacteria bacterium]|nr:FAD-dependent oxidoreductase [Acidobacteriota bacterium]
MLTILGGGPAGLATGFYSRHLGHPFRILEAAGRVGGNCVTEERDGFRFDRGAHRLHDKDPDITADLFALLGDEMVRVSAPSAVCTAGRFLRFPPSPPDLLAHLGPRRFAAATVGAMLTRFTTASADNFESFATRAYGPSLAQLFLLNYSEKLWGQPCAALSPRVSGGRLRGLQFSTLFTRPNRNATHLDGAFYYPARGYGRIVERIAEVCGPDTIRCGARITRLLHDGRRLTQVEVNGVERLPVDRVAATLPLSVVVRVLDPRPPGGILALADQVTFRHVALVAWFLARPSVTGYATVYFPEPTTPVTRVSEPRNRSPLMAPPNHTSLVAEVPCSEADDLWHGTDDAIVRTAAPALAALGWLLPDEVKGTTVVRVPNAYPVLTIEAEQAAAELVHYLGRFHNLHLLGRNGLFHYGWLHTMMRMAKTLVAGLPPPAVVAE